MKHFFSYAFVFLLLCVGAKAAETEKLPLGVLPPDACGVWCWYSWGGTPNKWNGKITADETWQGLEPDSFRFVNPENFLLIVMRSNITLSMETAVLQSTATRLRSESMY